MHLNIRHDAGDIQTGESGVFNYLRSNFRFSLCIIIVNQFYCPTNALNYTNLEVKIYVV